MKEKAKKAGWTVIVHTIVIIAFAVNALHALF